jgi:medium-chain acyl-CoA synthetase
VYDDRGPFKPQRLLKILHRYPITTLCAAPLAYRQLVLQAARDCLKEYPPLALSHCTAAGEALDGEVIKQWHQLTGLEIHDGYGQTESVLLCGNFGKTPIRPGSMGTPAPGVPLYIITSTGAEAAVGEEGDIAVLLCNKDGKSSFFGIFDGYLNDDNSLTRNEKIFTKNGETKTWYLTGDKAKRDIDGYFWFVGRSDDVINSSGYRIGTTSAQVIVKMLTMALGPFEVESTLKMHPAVAESAVISSPDPTRGEVVKAFVVLTSEYEDAVHGDLRNELQTFCKTNAAPYKYPRKLEFVHANFFPKTASGKIQRSELRKLEWRTEPMAVAKL